MPSSKDILEAQRFNRSRLITAFTSGTPDGREVDTPSPVRPLIFGLVVAIIISVIGIGMRVFAPNPKLGEAQYELIDVKGTGARYFWANGVLHPIANVTTARLLSPDSKLTTVQASAASLENIPRGAQIGLPDVPDDVPLPDMLSKQWLSCDMESGYHTWIAKELPADNFPVKQATSALVQASGSGDKYFVDRKKGKKYYIDSSVSRLGDWALSFQNLASYPITVEPEWLDLFPSGTPLRPWSYNDIENAGQPATNLPGDLKNEGITIGMVPRRSSRPKCSSTLSPSGPSSSVTIGPTSRTLRHPSGLTRAATRQAARSCAPRWTPLIMPSRSLTWSPCPRSARSKRPTMLNLCSPPRGRPRRAT